MDSNNDNISNNSNINNQQNNNDNDVEMSKINQITIEKLKKENNELSYALNMYNIFLKEYQKKYGDELLKQIENEFLNKEDEENLFKKNLLENIPLLKELEKNTLEKNDYINYLLEEKNNLQIENQKIKEENQNMQSDIKKLEKENEELLEGLNERIKQKQSKEKITYKTISNINKDTIEQEKQKLQNLEYNLNLNPNNDTNINFNTIKANNTNLLDNEKIDYDELNKYKINNENLKDQINILKNKLKQEIGEITKLENELISKQAKIDMLEIDNKNFKIQINNYKEAYEALEIRKKNETNNLINELKEIRKNMENNKNNYKRIEEQNLKYKSENTKLKKENEVLKSDRDHLTKIIEDSNNVVSNAAEREKYADNIIKIYKKKEDNIKLEKEKLELKIRMKENQINQINKDYNILLKEKINDYEILNNITKDKYEDIINNKDSEIKELKASLVSYKIEKDKYLSDYNLYKNEFDKIDKEFHTENDNYIKKYDEVQNELNSLSSKYEGTIKELKLKNEILENENNTMKKKENTYINYEKNYEKKIKSLERKEEELNRKNEKLKKDNDKYLKEESSYKEQIERIKVQSKTKIDQNKQVYDNKIINLEIMIEKQKKQLSLVEGKALEMVKKQQNLTEKYKKELQNTINNYENIINGRIPENLTTS